MRSALLLSPHLDDAAFSAGGIAHRLARTGWRVTIATVFTGGIHPATGFALACQRDKGLPDNTDYMALRRAEDLAAAAALGAATLHLDLPEAPNRGYHSPAALFTPPRPDDAVAPVARAIGEVLAADSPDLLLLPQGCGAHVDHVLVIEALLAHAPPMPSAFWRDTPYVIRDEAAVAHAPVSALALVDIAVPLELPDLAAKLDAACEYRSQIGFQFGGADETRGALARLAQRDGGERLLVTASAAELLLA